MGYVYPDTPLPSEGYSSGDEYLTLVSGPYASGRSVVGKARELPIFRASLSYPKMPAASLEPIVTLFRNCQGRYGTFAFFDFAGHDTSPVGVQWEDLYVGVGTGSTYTFDLPMKSTTSPYLYVNGVLKYNTVDYTLYSGTGTDGRDKITLVVAPTAGHIIELTAVGRRAVQARFTSDRLSVVKYAAGLVEASVEVEEAR